MNVLKVMTLMGLNWKINTLIMLTKLTKEISR